MSWGKKFSHSSFPQGEKSRRTHNCAAEQRSRDPGKWNISVPGGKETKRYSLSSGERKGRSPNPAPLHAWQEFFTYFRLFDFYEVFCHCLVGYEVVRGVVGVERGFIPASYKSLL